MMTTDASGLNEESGRTGGGMRWVIAIAVAVATSAFIPANIATADSFEAPKLLAWSVALAICAFARRSDARHGAAPWFALALLAWMPARTLVAGNAYDAMVLVGWMMLPALYLAGRGLGRVNTRAVAWACAVVAVFQCVLMLAQRFGLDPFFGATTAAMEYAPGRMVGTVGYHNQAVDLLAVCCALAPSVIPLTAIAAVPGAFAVLAAYRAGIAGVVAGLVAAGGIARRRGAWAAVAAMLAVAALCAAVPEARARISETARLGLSVPAMRTRTTMARAASSMIRERPLFGHGSGSYAFQYLGRVAGMRPEPTTHEWLQGVEYAREPHNDFLHIWSEFGVVGLALALGWLAATARMQPAAGRFLLGYWAMASLFGFPWHDTAAGPLFGLALGMLETADDGQAAERGGLNRGRFRAVISTTATVALALACGMIALAQIAAEMGAMEPFEWQGLSLAREGGLLAIEGRFSDAEGRLVRSLKTERSPEQLSNLGFVKMQLGKHDEAEPLYRELAASGICHFDALRGLSSSLEKMGRRGEAAEVEAERFRLWPDKFGDDEVYRLCSLKLLAGDGAYAEWMSRNFQERCRQRSRMEAWTPEWENLRGGALMALGRREEAKACFTEALRRKPGLASARRNLQNLLRDGRD